MASMHARAHDDDDEPETWPCYRHPNRQTALRCIECERPICVDCAVQGPVGFKCPDDARTSRAARGVVPTHRLARGIAAGLVVALVLGSALAVANVPFFGLILGYFVGAATGAVTKRASGGYHDPMLAKAAACAVVGVLAVPAFWVVTGSSVGTWLIYKLVAAAFAAYGALTRA
jgi:hypothetical protein